MEKPLKTYLSGSLSQHPLNPSVNYWTPQDEKLLKDIFNKKSKVLDILNPNDADFQNGSHLFEYELDYVEKCDFVLVELSERRGIGVGIEIYHSYLKKIPVFSICPDNSYYLDTKRNYFHPFLENIITENFSSKGELFEFLDSSY